MEPSVVSSNAVAAALILVPGPGEAPHVHDNVDDLTLG